jgi:hypothetical protein
MRFLANIVTGAGMFRGRCLSWLVVFLLAI